MWRFTHESVIDGNDDDYDVHERHMRGDADGNHRSLSIARRPVSQRHPGRQERDALALTIRVINANSGCAPVPNANVEIWHVDAAGDYSQYGTQTTQTFLRGIQTTNSNGEVTFTTIYPGWYQGRATHIHVEVTMAGRSVKVTQIAFPESLNNTVHASGVYASRGTNPMSNLADGILLTASHPRSSRRAGV